MKEDTESPKNTEISPSEKPPEAKRERHLEEEKKPEDLIVKLEKLRAILENERKKGAGRLKGKRTIQEVVEDPTLRDENVIVDGNLAVLLAKEGELRIVGDLHGDAKAIEAILRDGDFEKKLSQGKGYLVFLGDYCNRGFNDIGVIEEMVRLKENYGERVIFLKGNHEREEKLKEETIEPTLFKSLSQKYDDEMAEKILRAFLQVTQVMPTVLVTRNGILAFHGGVPEQKISSLSDLREMPPEIEKGIIENAPDRVLTDGFGEEFLAEGRVTTFGKKPFEEFLDAIGAKVAIRPNDEPFSYILPDQGYVIYENFDRRLAGLISTGKGSEESGFGELVDFPKYASFELAEEIYKFEEKHFRNIPYSPEISQVREKVEIERIDEKINREITQIEERSKSLPPDFLMHVETVFKIRQILSDKEILGFETTKDFRSGIINEEDLKNFGKDYEEALFLMRCLSFKRERVYNSPGVKVRILRYLLNLREKTTDERKIQEINSLFQKVAETLWGEKLEERARRKEVYSLYFDVKIEELRELALRREFQNLSEEDRKKLPEDERKAFQIFARSKQFELARRIADARGATRKVLGEELDEVSILIFLSQGWKIDKIEITPEGKIKIVDPEGKEREISKEKLQNLKEELLVQIAQERAKKSEIEKLEKRLQENPLEVIEEAERLVEEKIRSLEEEKKPPEKPIQKIVRKEKILGWLRKGMNMLWLLLLREIEKMKEEAGIKKPKKKKKEEEEEEE